MPFIYVSYLFALVKPSRTLMKEAESGDIFVTFLTEEEPLSLSSAGCEGPIGWSRMTFITLKCNPYINILQVFLLYLRWVLLHKPVWLQIFIPPPFSFSHQPRDCYCYFYFFSILRFILFFKETFSSVFLYLFPPLSLVSYFLLLISGLVITQ